MVDFSSDLVQRFGASHRMMRKNCPMFRENVSVFWPFEWPVSQGIG